MTTHRAEKHHSAKLTWAKVCDIRERYAARDEVGLPVSYRSLGREYGVSAVMVFKIVKGQSWTSELQIPEILT